MVVMRSIVLLLFAAGCTLAKTHEQGDAPSVSCATPAFTSAAMQANTSVTDFNVDSAGDLAVAMCGTNACQGSATSLAMSQLSAQASFTFATPRITPGGNELFVRATSNLGTNLQTFTRAAGTAWDFEGVVSFNTAPSVTAATTLSQATLGERGRHMIIADGASLTEYV